SKNHTALQRLQRERRRNRAAGLCELWFATGLRSVTKSRRRRQRQNRHRALRQLDRKSTRLNSSHLGISYAVFCLKKKIEYVHIATLSNRDVEDGEDGLTILVKLLSLVFMHQELYRVTIEC